MLSVRQVLSEDFQYFTHGLYNYGSIENTNIRYAEVEDEQVLRGVLGGQRAYWRAEGQHKNAMKKNQKNIDKNIAISKTEVRFIRWRIWKEGKEKLLRRKEDDSFVW